MATDTRATDLHVYVPQAGTPGERLSRGGGWWTLILTLVMLGIVAEAISAANWSEGLGVMRLALLAGALLGFALALTRWEGAFPVFYSLLASIVWITMLEIQALLGAPGLHDGVQQLIQRNISWAVAFASGAPSADNLIFVTQLSYLAWWLGYFAAWSLFRHQHLLAAIIPIGVALLVNLYYSPVNLSGYLIAFLVIVLTLAVRVELARNETRWQIARIRYAPDIYLDFLKAGVGFALIVVTLAWFMPDVADRVSFERILRPFDRPWHNVEDTWSRMYQSLNYPVSAPVVTRFGKSLTLGGPIALSDRPIFEAQFPWRTYWRAVAYDSYDGRGWLNTDEEVVIVERNQSLGEPTFSLSTEMTATIRSLEQGQDVIFAPPQAVRVSVPVDADVAKPHGTDSAVNISMMRSRVDIPRSSSYRVVSAITDAPPELLRTDKVTYPTWVTERYLQLPGTLPARVKRLATRITTRYDNPFDKASAVETYLRQYTYNLNIAAPPAGRDSVDYFLFDLKQGYCDYYASAMAVMLRAVGIPARFVVGYTPGQYIPPSDDRPNAAVDTYQVQERNAHAWVEAFFPTYGWIQFEPTASEPLLARPVPMATGTPQPMPTPNTADDENLRDLRGESGPQAGDLVPTQQAGVMGWLQAHWVGLLSAGGVLALIAGFWVAVRQRRLALFRDSELVTKLFGLLGTWAGRLKIPWPASHTPLEHADQFRHRLPETGPAVNRLAILFAAERYGRQRPDAEALTHTAEDWQQLQPLFWKRWLSQTLTRKHRGKR